jgi:hypothetical protein
MKLDLKVPPALVITYGPEVAGLHRFSFQKSHHTILVFKVDK